MPSKTRGIAAKAVYSVKEKISLFKELPEWVHYFFREDYPFEADVVQKLKAKPENAALLEAAAIAIGKLGNLGRSGHPHRSGVRRHFSGSQAGRAHAAAAFCPHGPSARSGRDHHHRSRGSVPHAGSHRSLAL